jgi:hypothetical protein
MTIVLLCLLSDYCGISRAQQLLISTFAATHGLDDPKKRSTAHSLPDRIGSRSSRQGGHHIAQTNRASLGRKTQIQSFKQNIPRRLSIRSIDAKQQGFGTPSLAASRRDTLSTLMGHFLLE